MEAETIDHQVAIINNSIEIFRGAPGILRINQEKSQKALAVGKSILQQWAAAWQIEDETERLEALAVADNRSNTYLVNCGTALATEKESRAAITQMMDEFKKMFTGAENEIDRTKPNTVPSRVQEERNSFAKESFEITERKRREAEIVAAKAKEAIDIRANMEVNLSSQYNAYLLKKKQGYTTSFNAITLADFEAKSEVIKSLNPEFKFLAEQICTIKPLYHSDGEMAGFVPTICDKMLPNFKQHFATEIGQFITEMIDKLPSKKAELLEAKRLADEADKAAEIAKEAEQKRLLALETANANERKRLEQEALEAKVLEDERLAKLKDQQEKADQEKKAREAAEAEKLEQEAAQANTMAQQNAEITKQGEQTMVMFEQEATMAENANTAEARQGYEITITHQAGYVQIFQLWFEGEGKNLPIDKIAGTKMEQMKAWAEKQAHKTGTKIESKFLKYTESFKAVNRKAK